MVYRASEQMNAAQFSCAELLNRHKKMIIALAWNGGHTRAGRMASFAALGTLLSSVLLAGPAQVRDVIRGVNFVHPLQFSTDDQNAKLSELQSLGVHVIRFGMYAEDEDKNVDFIKRAYAHKISTVLILHGLYAPGAPVRPFRPKEFPGV